MNSRFVRLAETGRAAVPIRIDGQPAQALAGDTLLVALLTHGKRVRDSEFGDGTRAGFCLMGACQDCWVWSERGERLRACSTPVQAGMAVLTRPPAALLADDAGPGDATGAGTGGRAMSSTPRIVIVGAGPAGVRAAQALVEAGVRPVLVDEGLRDGGQIYRRQPEGFTRSYAKLYGSEAAKAQALHDSFTALRERIDYHGGTLAWNVTAGELHAVRDGAALTLPFDALIVCSGATDRLMPVPGLAARRLLQPRRGADRTEGAGLRHRRAHRLPRQRAAAVPGGHAIPASRCPKSRRYWTPPRLLKSWAAVRGLLARPRLAWRGLAMMRSLRRAGVAVLQGVTPVAIEGDDAHGATAVRVRDARGRELRFETDAVALGWHLRAESQLADLARCEFIFEPRSRQWLPRIDADGRSSVKGVYLAGDGARILGADGAEAAGRLAALAALADLGHAQGAQKHEDEAPRLRATLARLDRFRAGLDRSLPLAARTRRDAA